MLKDILFEDNDIHFSRGDIITIQDDEVLKQNIIKRITTPRGSVFFDTNFGSELHKMIKSKNKNLRKIELHIKKVLIECDEIDPDTIEVKASRYGEDLILKCSFEILGNKLIEKLFLSIVNQEIEAGFYANNTN